MAIDPETGLEIPDEAQQAATAQEAMGTLAPQAPATTVMPDMAAPTAATSPLSGPELDQIASAPLPSAVAPVPTMTVPQPPTLDLSNPTKATQQLSNFQNTLAQAGVQNANAAGDLNKQKAEQAAKQAEQAAEENRRFQADRAAEAQAQKDLIQKATDDYQNSIAEKRQADGQAQKGYFDDRGSGSRLGAALFLALGGIGAALQNAGGMAGAQNQAYASLNRLIDQDREKKKADVDAASDRILMARTGINDARQARVEALRDVDLQHGARLEQLQDQAKQYLAQLGVPAADIDKNAVVLGLQQKGADQQNQYVKDTLEEQHNRATEALANANLGIARGHLSLSRDEMLLRHEDREADREAKEAAKKSQQNKGLEDRAIRDPVTGDDVGYAPTARQATAINDKLNGQKAYMDAVKALRDHVEEHGRIVNPLTDEAKVRDQLFADAVARGRKARELGVSGANLALEHKAFSGSGVGFDRSPSVRVLDQMIEDQQKITGGIVRQLVPLKAGGSSKPENSPSQSPKNEPAKTATPPKLDPGDAKAMIRAHAAGDTRFDSLLKSNGLL